ncbi:MAG TPA: NAD(P)H-dependent oxidoreductase subunit E [Candidatus Saccharimonadales bacterium]|nr:NAD(P)H-dependent oxidoreductase subunit E [Candidatus Saccharimonadales bacterium]
MSLDRATRDRVAELATRYPTRRAALLPALWLVQDERGWVPRDDLAEVAGMLGLAPADAEGVASFYFLFSRTPTGRTVIDVCDNIICRANGAEALLSDLCAGLGIDPGGTTADGAVTVRRQECIAACHEAPAVQVDLDYRGSATAADLLAELGR